LLSLETFGLETRNVGKNIVNRFLYGVAHFRIFPKLLSLSHIEGILKSL